MNKYTAEGLIIINQCCVCRLPEFPAGTHQTQQSHGYHSQCFRTYHKEDYTPEEMEEEMSLWKPTIPGDEML